MPFGLTTEGFSPKTLELIRDDINAAYRAAFGTSVDVSDGSILGMLAGIMAERYALLWELAEAVYSSQDPDKATGAAIERCAVPQVWLDNNAHRNISRSAAEICERRCMPGLRLRRQRYTQLNSSTAPLCAALWMATLGWPGNCRRSTLSTTSR